MDDYALEIEAIASEIREVANKAISDAGSTCEVNEHICVAEKLKATLVNGNLYLDQLIREMMSMNNE